VVQAAKRQAACCGRFASGIGYADFKDERYRQNQAAEPVADLYGKRMAIRPRHEVARALDQRMGSLDFCLLEIEANRNLRRLQENLRCRASRNKTGSWRMHL
jgi:hypothetical protein